MIGAATRSVDPCEPLEPLLFTEIALAAEVPREIQLILDEEAPTLDEAAARVAVFYSISNTRPELRGRSLGFDLLRRTVDELRRALPQVQAFVTLFADSGLQRMVGDVVRHGSGRADSRLRGNRWAFG